MSAKDLLSFSQKIINYCAVCEHQNTEKCCGVNAKYNKNNEEIIGITVLCKQRKTVNF